ncbi:TRAP transporter, DctM subunit [uncultured delta proteobacterium]|uniref:TRAP transporter, DctM subunit n=1 Tax=uncultured delta proteobacterium TaxID=34034 RepID=A0A212K7V3_9DELT|nr:TRAP transporter, DctM subunit [uncultured delta proteobacterium]
MILLAILFGGFFLLAFLGVPIAVSLGVAAMGGMIFSNVPLMSLPQKMFTAVDSFSFMAIPFFMLAGKLMETGGISRRLIRFADGLLCRIKGGLSVATVVACAFFAALSGSSPGTVAAIGSVMYPEMTKLGYDEEFAAGLITVAGGLGPIIPPSILMVTLGVTTGISISALFMGGLVVGIILTAALCTCAYIICSRKGYGPARKSAPFREIVNSLLAALPALGMPMIILGGIYGGVFTPTEAAAVAVVYSLFVGKFVYNELTLKDLIITFEEAAIAATVILFIISTSVAFSWIFARQGLATMIVTQATALFTIPTLFLVATFVILLVFGTFMEGNAIILLLMPFMYPVAQKLNIDVIHFGVMATVALVIGCCSPPVAVNIFTAVGITKLPMGRVIRGMMPFFLVMVFFTFIMLFFPQVSSFLPNLLGK